MILTLNTSTKTFQYTFALSLLVFAIVLFAAASYSWTGPTGTAPANNVSAPINVGTASQVKSGALSVNGLSVYGSQYISGNLGVGASAGAWKVYATGGQYGIYGEGTSGQAIRGATTGGGYAGYFIGGGSNAGGVFAQNSSGYYAFLGYPGSTWSVYGNGNSYMSGYSRADGGFCIGGSCKTSWGALGGSYWTGWTLGPVGHSCATGYIMTGIDFGEYNSGYVPVRILCTSIAP